MEVSKLTVRNRIAAIRLSNKLERNSEYAKMIGVSVVNGKMEKIEENNVGLKQRKKELDSINNK